MRRRFVGVTLVVVFGSGCASDPWESGGRLEADIYEADGVRTLIDFVDVETKQHCVGEACGSIVKLSKSFRESEIDGVVMEGWEGDDGSWQFERLYDPSHDAPCSMVPFDGELRCVGSSIFTTATTSCAEQVIECGADELGCSEGTLATVDRMGAATIYELGSETDAPEDPGCVITTCAAGCLYRELEKVAPADLPRVFEKDIGSGRWVVPSYTSSDGSWSVPIATNTLLDTETMGRCRLVRGGDGVVTCEAIP